jgi:REP element-mobilizing transposase RayT
MYQSYSEHIFRLRGWDYRWEAYYFITMSCQDRERYFGEVVDGKMCLTQIGYVAKRFWRNIFQHHPVAKIDAFVVMPNHVHGIIKLCPGFLFAPPLLVAPRPEAVTPQYIAGVRERDPIIIGPKKDSVGSIIRTYKGAVSRYAAKKNIDFQWQGRFHDRIIRSEDELNNVRLYIQRNPKKWTEDGK